VPELALENLPPGDLVAVAAGRGPLADRAWKLLVERHVNLVWKVVRCFGLPREASEEAYQSTWLRAIERLDTLRDPDRFPGWLASIARHEALGVIRARNKVVLSDRLPDQPATDSSPGDRMQRNELCTAVREAYAQLGRPCQDLLRLLTVDPPVAYREIEELLGMAHGSIGPTRRRCLDKLRRMPSMETYLAENDE
jgi:RNA polymerase sigma factor (sigma-70 family)